MPHPEPSVEPAAGLAYDVVEVFTGEGLAGNPLAVVHDAAALPTDDLVGIARDFGFSETTFPTPVDPQRYRVRILTPGGEIPFAGHPTLGTAWLLREQGALTGDVVQECLAGQVPVRFRGDRVELEARPGDLVGPLGEGVTEALLTDVGLSEHDLAGQAWLAGCGLTFVHLPVHESAVARAHPGTRHLASVIGAAANEITDPLGGLNLYAVRRPDRGAAEVHSIGVHARVFVPELDVPEDPATGSAAAGLGLVLVETGLLEGGATYTIDQGIELGRPSRLNGRVSAADGRATRVWVSGAVRHVASGTIPRPDHTS